MHRDEAMDILRALARDGADANSFSLGLVDTVHRDWPDSFADILPAPRDLIGQRCLISTRDVHLKGLQEAIEERLTLGAAVATAKLRYHARWLLYLGEPGHEAPPKLSIIIPIYNRAWLVDSLIQNCLDQSYSQIEIVVVDDGSTDDTAIRLAAFGDRIKLIRQPNSGVSAARNAAVLAATGELVQFLDSDDLLHTGHVEAKVGAFAAIPDSDLCYCKATDVSLFGVKPSLRPDPSIAHEDDASPPVDLLDSILAHGYPFFVGSVTMPRHVCLHCGPFDTDLRRAEDERYWFRLALLGAKVIGLARRLFYRCPMTDGLNERRYLDSTPSIIVTVRNVVDLLRIPERWPAAAEYLSAQAKNWSRLLHSEGGTYGRDFHILLQTIADLPRAGHGSNRSPLPLLVFLWMLGERARAPKGTVRELLANGLLAAIAKAEPSGPIDKDDWVHRGPKLRLKWVFAELLSVGAIPKLSSEIGPKVDEAVAFLRNVAGVVGDQGKWKPKLRLKRVFAELLSVGAIPKLSSEIGPKVDEAVAFLRNVAGVVGDQGKWKPRPSATVVVPVLADPPAARATIASCLAQTVADRIEIIAIEKDRARAAFWSEEFPQIRVIVSPTAGSCVEAHSAGLDSAQSALIRFLLPGDTLESRSLSRQIRTSKRFDREIVVVEGNGRNSNEPGVSVRPLEASLDRQPQTMFSAMLFPRSVLACVGGFDLALGQAYQARYLFRLMAAGVSAAFIKTNSASIYAMPPASSADQTDIAVLANLIQCLGDRHLWRHIPFVLRSLGAVEGKVTENRELHSLKTRLLEFTLNAIAELSANAASHSPLAAFALCLVGLEWSRPPADPSSTPQLEALRSALLDGTAGLSLDTLGELLLTESLAEARDDPSFAKAAKSVSSAVHGGPQHAGLRVALLCLQEPSESSRRPTRSPPRLTLMDRLNRTWHGPSS